MKKYFLLLILGTSFFCCSESNLLEDSSFSHQFEAESMRIILSPEEILAFTTGLIKWQDLAQEEFFLRTNELELRNVLDLPFVKPCPVSLHKKKVAFSIIPFYSQISKAYFTHNSDALGSYLALTEDTLLDKLRETFAIIQAIQPEFYVNTDNIFGLLQQTFVEQRRVGLLFNLSKKFKWGTLGLQLPFVYVERNFQMTEKNKKLLENDLGASTPEAQAQFQKDHLISDKLGLADIRLYFDRNLHKSEGLVLSAGLFSTIPTEVRFTKGLAGTLYPRPSTYPQFNIITLFEELFDTDSATQDQSFAIVNGLALDALNRLSAVLLDAPLGNRRHWGVGIDFRAIVGLDDILFDPPYDADHTMKLDNFLSVEYLIPRTERRFFINSVDQEGFETLDLDDPTQAAANLTFLQDQTIQRYFLRAFTATVHPGVIFRAQNILEYQLDFWNLKIGSDGWLKTETKITLPQTLLGQQPLIDVALSQGMVAYQWGALAGFSYRLERETFNCTIGLDLFATFFNRGIGKEYGASITTQMTF
jgi:hypothetical protein